MVTECAPLANSAVDAEAAIDALNPLAFPQATTLPVVSRHDSAHKLLEQGHSERRVSMAWTPNHALRDQLVPGRPKGSHLAIQLFGDVTGAMRARTKFGHCPQVSFLQSGQTVEPNPEETFVKRSNGFGRGLIDIVQIEEALRAVGPRARA